MPEEVSTLQMKRKRIRLALAITATGLGWLPTVSGCSVWKQSRDVAMRSCLASIRASLESPTGTQLGLTAPTGQTWESLSAGEADRLLAALAQKGELDCRAEGSGESIVDAQGNHLGIAVRLSDGRREVKVWSNGADGLPNTTDDIVSAPE